MSHNTFGHLFRVTTFGESHGIALGCVVDGCPPGLPLEAEEIQAELDRRKPGQSRFTTQRRELRRAASRGRGAHEHEPSPPETTSSLEPRGTVASRKSTCASAK